MEQELVSIVVPIYKVEQYLARCLDSIAGQIHRPLDVILVNDGSPDGCQAIIDDYVSRYPEIFRSYSQENSGLGPTRNKGIELARGYWIAFVDSDDYIEPDYVSGMLKIADEKDSDIVVSNFYLEMQSGKKYPFPLMTMYKNLSGEKAAKESLNLLTVPNFAWNKLYKISLFRDNDIEFPKLKYEDVAVTTQLMVNAEVVSVTQKPYYHYCQRESSIVGNFNIENVREYLDVVALVGHFLADKGLIKKWRSSWDTFLRHVKTQVSFQIMVQMKDYTYSERLELINQVRRELKKINREVTSDSGVREEVR